MAVVVCVKKVPQVLFKQKINTYSLCDVSARKANAITEMGKEQDGDRHPHGTQLHTCGI